MQVNHEIAKVDQRRAYIPGESERPSSAPPLSSTWVAGVWPAAFVYALLMSSAAAGDVEPVVSGAQALPPMIWDEVEGDPGPVDASEKPVM